MKLIFVNWSYEEPYESGESTVQAAEQFFKSMQVDSVDVKARVLDDDGSIIREFWIHVTRKIEGDIDANHASFERVLPTKQEIITWKVKAGVDPLGKITLTNGYASFMPEATSLSESELDDIQKFMQSIHK